MSVAFRRESDEEHLEPKFELPIPPGPNLVTAQGLAQIEARVVALQALVAHETDEAALKAAKRDLRYWGTRQATAQLMTPAATETVTFGAHVTFMLDDEERVLHLVGGDEADPAAGKIAFTAPLARVLMGSSVGDCVDFAGREDAIEILAID